MLIRLQWLLVLAGVGLLGAGATPSSNQDGNISFVYNDYMASLSTSPELFTGTFGNYRLLTADSLPALQTAGAQLMLVSLRACSAFSPYYQVNAAETLYVKSGKLDVVLLVDGQRLKRSLKAGDVVTVPAGALHAYLNTGCQDAEALVLATRASPFCVYPVEQALSMPQQAVISGFGLSNYSQFKDPIRQPRARLFSLNDPACTAACAPPPSNQTGAPSPAPAAPAGGPAPADQQQPPQRRRLAAAAAAQAAAAVTGAPAAEDSAARLPARRLAQQPGGAKSGGGGGGSRRGASGQARAGRRRLLASYNDYMGSLSKAPANIENEFATQRQLTSAAMPGLARTGMRATHTEFKACSMSAMHFQLDADEVATVLSGTIDMILLVNDTRRPGETRKVVRTLQPGDVAVIPRGTTHYFANANCDPNTLLSFHNTESPTELYLLTDMLDLPSEVLTAALGLQGGPSAYPDWRSNIDVPSSQLGSLNDAQCITRCQEASSLQTSSSSPSPVGD